MFSCLRTEAAALFFAALLLVACAGTTAAQDDELGDDAADPIKLFDRGQEAHARREFEQAL